MTKEQFEQIEKMMYECIQEYYLAAKNNDEKQMLLMADRLTTLGRILKILIP